jgi:hypothetical protein
LLANGDHGGARSKHRADNGTRRNEAANADLAASSAAAAGQVLRDPNDQEAAESELSAGGTAATLDPF